MPSPLAHAAAGWCLHRYLGRDLPPPPVPVPAAGLLLTIGLSLLPDLDFLPGLLLADPRGWHNQGGHSLFAAVVAALLVAPLLRLLLGGDLRRWLSLVFFCYAGHVLMDSFSQGRGVRLMWPFWIDRFAPPQPLFCGVRWSEGWWTVKHLWTAANELGFAVLVWALCLLADRRRQASP